MVESFGLTEVSAPEDGLIAGDFPLKTKTVTIKNGEGEVDRGTLLGEIKKEVGTATYGGGNTGDGTIGSIVMGLFAKIGNYVLTCILGPTDTHTAPTTGTAAGGNTGNGTMTAVTASDEAKKGTYTLVCITAPGGTPTVPTTGTVTGTGNGTMTGVSAGADVQAGNYVATCEDATVSGSEVFKVVDPDGNRLDDATVGVVYTSSQIYFEINDGSTDFVVGDYITVVATAVDGDNGTFKVIAPDGSRLDDAVVGTAYTSEQINFTLNDGATDFAIDDEFTLAVGNGGLFALVDPAGNALPSAEVGVAYTNAQINFTVADGSADWLVGDTITVPIEAPGSVLHIESLAAAVDGSQEPDSILTEDVDATSAAVLKSAYHTGDFNTDKMTFGTGHTAANTKAAAKEKNMYWYDEVTQVPTSYV